MALPMAFLSVPQNHTVIMIQLYSFSQMDNEFVSSSFGRTSQNTFPVRISPLDLSNRHLLNKIRINHTKLPSQFFANPRSMPDLQLVARMPSIQIWKKRRQKTVNLAEDSSAREAISLGSYKSVQRRKEQEQERKINDLFAQNEDLAVTFSKLPIRRAENSCQQRRQLGKVYFNKMNTEGHEKGISKGQKGFGMTMKIERLMKGGSQGITVRKNNHHPITTLREMKRQCM